MARKPSTPKKPVKRPKPMAKASGATTAKKMSSKPKVNAPAKTRLTSKQRDPLADVILSILATSADAPEVKAFAKRYKVTDSCPEPNNRLRLKTKKRGLELLAEYGALKAVFYFVEPYPGQNPHDGDCRLD